MMRVFVIILLALFYKIGSAQLWFDELETWDIIDFEAERDFLQVNCDTNNIWQIGRPQKVLFNHPLSGDKAIITDTNVYYPPNNYSYFDLYIGNFNMSYFYPWNVCLEFKHKFDTDTLKDGGYLTISYDKGETWQNMEKSFCWAANDIFGFYDKSNILFNGEHGFSGRSDEWITSVIAWYEIPCKSSLYLPDDTTIIRFNFISDSIDNAKEGWMIDDIRLFSLDLGGSVYNMEGNGYKIFPNPTKDFINIIPVDPDRNMNIMIRDISGKLIFEEKNRKPSGALIVNTSGYQSGIYLLYIYDGQYLEKVDFIVVQ